MLGVLHLAGRDLKSARYFPRQGLRTLGFPPPFSIGPEQVLLTFTLIAVIALPGMAAARVSPRAVPQD